MAQNIRTLKKVIEGMAHGESIYLNTIGFSIAMVEQLRKYIEDGILLLDDQELDCMIKKEAQPRFKSGYSICPQMTYIKA